MSLRRRRDFYDEADFMYEKDRQEKVDSMKEQDTGAMTRTEDEYAHIRKEMEESYMQQYNDLLRYLSHLYDTNKHRTGETVLRFEDLKEVLDKFR